MSWKQRNLGLEQVHFLAVFQLFPFKGSCAMESKNHVWGKSAPTISHLNTASLDSHIPFLKFISTPVQLTLHCFNAHHYVMYVLFAHHVPQCHRFCCLCPLSMSCWRWQFRRYRGYYSPVIACQVRTGMTWECSGIEQQVRIVKTTKTKQNKKKVVLEEWE